MLHLLDQNWGLSLFPGSRISMQAVQSFLIYTFIQIWGGANFFGSCASVCKDGAYYLCLVTVLTYKYWVANADFYPAWTYSCSLAPSPIVTQLYFMMPIVDSNIPYIDARHVTSLTINIIYQTAAGMFKVLYIWRGIDRWFWWNSLSAYKCSKTAVCVLQPGCAA